MSTPEIITTQEIFNEALNHLSGNTRKRHIRNLGIYLNWLDHEQLTASEARTADILAFIATLQDDHNPEQVHRIVHTIKTWYTFKGYKRNPALGIKVRYKRSGVPHDLLGREDLDKLYYEYGCTKTIDYRHKLLLGLLVFQGLSRSDLERLKVSHVELASGKLHVPGSKQVNGRILPLQACQILEIKTYLEEIRPQFNPTTGELLVNFKKPDAKYLLHRLFKVLRSRYPSVKNAPQIRQSVITEWLKEKDVRIVQYMAGHKNVSSTERYQAANLEDLQEQLNKFHPLG